MFDISQDEHNSSLGTCCFGLFTSLIISDAKCKAVMCELHLLIYFTGK